MRNLKRQYSLFLIVFPVLFIPVLFPESIVYLIILQVYHFIFGASLTVPSCPEPVFFERHHQYLYRLPVHLYLSVNGYLTEYGGCGHPFHAGLSGLRLPEVYEQVFLHRILHSVQLVVAVQLVYLFSFVPVLVPLLQQGMRLRIYSLVVDGRPVIQ